MKKKTRTLGEKAWAALKESREGDPEKDWDEFWKPILAPNGEINLEQLKNELSDFLFIMREVPKVYCEITGNVLSKLTYYSDVVINKANEHYENLYEEEEFKMREELAVRDAKIAELESALARTRESHIQLFDEVNAKDEEIFVLKAKERLPTISAEKRRIEGMLAERAKESAKEVWMYLTNLYDWYKDIPDWVSFETWWKNRKNNGATNG